MNPREAASADGGPGRERQIKRSLARASVLFGSLFVANVTVVATLLFRDLDRQAISAALLAAKADALRLAEGIGRVGAPAGGFDYFRILEREQVLTRVLNEFLARRQVIHHVEVRDALGNTVLRMQRGGETRMVTAPGGLPFGFAPQGPEGPPVSGPGTYVWETPVRERVVGVPVPGGPVGAVLQMGVAEEALEEEARKVRRSLVTKLVAGAAISLVLLVVAFLYVLRLLRRTRRLEADAHVADRLAHVATLASGLAHEIRNPLNAMSMNLQMLEEEIAEAGGKDGEALQLLAASRSEVHRLEKLVQDFLAYARPSDAPRSLEDPAKEVADVVAFLRPQFDEAGVLLTLETPEEVPPVPLAADHFRQALINVIQNALQASSPGATVTVRVATTPGSGVGVEVIDRGPGIPPEKLDRIFEVFFSDKPGGSGLGLPIAKRILEAHGGSIEIDSGLGRGTTVRFLLPGGAVKPGPVAPPAAVERR